MMNAPTPLQLHAGGTAPQLNNPLTAVVRVVNPHHSLGVDHKIITGILTDAGKTITQKAISSSSVSESWRTRVLDIFADLYVDGHRKLPTGGHLWRILWPWFLPAY
ncbi:hypothetical protein, partial [Rhodococcus qingshengii]